MGIKGIISWFLTICFFTLNTACSLNPAESSQSSGPKVPSVYTAGYYSDGIRNTACYWKDTERVDLDGSSAFSSTANSICIADGIVYAAGVHYAEASNYACYWRDGARIDLSSDGYASDARALFVSDGVVYVAGHHARSTGEPGAVGCYWVGESRTDFELEGDLSANIKSIFVYEGVVYTAGNYYDPVKAATVPCYWTGNVRTDLPVEGTKGAQITDVFISDGIQYFAGYYFNEDSEQCPCYWREAERIDLPVDNFGRTGTSSIYVYNGVVYVSGSTFDGAADQACFWAGQNLVKLPGAGDGSSSYTKSIVVSDGVVCTACHVAH